MKFASALLLFLISFNSTTTIAQQVQWIARYDGSVNYHDKATDIALDGAGNVYVTGYSYGSIAYYDYATIKYNSSGDTLWVARYNGPGNGYDIATAIAVDGAGNVYVTGRSEEDLGNDYATIKYNSNGVEEWVARYNGTANSQDEATAIAVDASGNVYVTGHSRGTGTWGDYATIKYNSSGDTLWVARYNGPGNWHDIAKDIVVDGAGNVYVTGQSNYDCATIKYNSSGDTLWVARYNNWEDDARAIALDESGNVYVSGRTTDGIVTFSDYLTIKYNSSGVEEWVSRYGGSGAYLYEANAMVVDATGNVYVTGYTSISSYHTTIKYNSDGDKLWIASHSDSVSYGGHATGIAVDALGNVYVTGYSLNISAHNDYATIKYDSLGKTKWVARYNGPANESDLATAIAVDASGNVYVTGYSIDPNTRDDYTTIKYVQGPVSVQNGQSLPIFFTLYQSYPNPFNPSTKIKYQLPEQRYVTLKVFDVLGKEITTLVNKEKTAGSYEVEFNASSLPSGVYFYRLQAGSFVETKKMVLMK